MPGRGWWELEEDRGKQKLQLERSPIFLARAGDDAQSWSAMRVQSTRRSLRGPSNSQKKMFCQRESPSRPSTTGMVSDPGLEVCVPVAVLGIVQPDPLGDELAEQVYDIALHALVPVLLDHERGRRALCVDRDQAPLHAATNAATSAVMSISSSRSWLPIRMACCMVVPALRHLAHRGYNVCHRPRTNAGSSWAQHYSIQDEILGSDPLGPGLRRPACR